MFEAVPHFANDFIDVEQLRRWKRKPTDDDGPLPPRFSLLALMAISTGAAIYCGLLRLFGVYGVMLMLGVLIAIRLVRVAGPWRPVKRVVADMLAGIVLPIGCLAFDPGVFRHGGGISEPLSFADQMFIYTLLGTEMVVLFVWLLVGGAFNSFGRSVTGGVLMLGSLICMALGIVLSLIGCGLVVFFSDPIGLLGFVPWFTMATFMANARRTATPSHRQQAVAVGTLLGVVLPLMLAAAVGLGAWMIAPNVRAIPGANVGHWQEMLIHH